MSKSSRNLGQSLLGLLIIIVGGGFLLDSLNVLDFNTIISRTWPVIIIAAGLASLISSPRKPFWPLSVMAVGALLLLNRLEVVDFNIGQIIWPIVIIAFGLSLIFDKLGKDPHTADAKTGSNHFVAFSGIEHRNTSDDYRGGSLQALFGGITLDLKDATIKDEAQLTIFAGFGGVELQIPKGWRLELSGVPLLGGIENKTEQTIDKKAPVLRVRANCFCGGVSFKN